MFPASYTLTGNISWRAFRCFLFLYLSYLASSTSATFTGTSSFAEQIAAIVVRTARVPSTPVSVSYTHLDVYKTQASSM